MSKRTAAAKTKKGSAKKPRLSRQRSFIVPSSRTEMKNIDADANAKVVFNQTTAVVTLINATTQGVTAVQHVGRLTKMRSLLWRYHGHLAPTTTGTASLRLLIVYDKQPNGAQPATTTIMAVDSIESPMNLNFSHRFIPLHDEIIPCVGVQGPQSWGLKGFKKIDLPCEFQSSNGDITDITTGAIYTLTWQDGGLLIASPASQLYTRIRFEDA